MKIRTRLTLYFALLVTALIMVGSFITYISLDQYNEQEFYNRLRANALTTAALFFKVENMDSNSLKMIDKAQNGLLLRENISIFDIEGHQIYTNNDTANIQTSFALLAQIRSKKTVEFSEGNYKVTGLYYEDKKNKAEVIAGAIDNEGEAWLKQVRLVLLLTLLASIIATAAIGWFFVGTALEPISSIIQKITALSPVEHSERLPERNEKDEIAALVKTFNDLFDKLEESFSLEKNFVANVSHEINNPLTKIKSQLEVSLIQKRDSESYRETMQSILEDVNELIDLIHDLLNFSKLSSKRDMPLLHTRVDELLFDVRNNILTQHPNYNVAVSFSNPPQSDERFIIYCNKQLIATAIKNIVENACKFSPDKTASLNLNYENDALFLSVADKGPGIPAKEIPYVFKLFYRLPNRENAKGYGIGLALAQRILKLHQYEIKVDSKPGEGTTFTIRFSN